MTDSLINEALMETWLHVDMLFLFRWECKLQKTLNFTCAYKAIQAPFTSLWY